MKNTLIFLFIMISYTKALQAQTKIWGAGAPTGVAEGEFQQAFVDTTVLGSYAPNTWTALSIYDTDTIFPGAAYWTRSLLGYSLGAYWGATQPLMSPSQSNGLAIFDSDYLDNRGVEFAFGTGDAPSRHKGALISPRIDLSGYMDSSLMVQFFSFYRAFEIDELSLSLSLDDGQTWSAAIDYRSLQEELYPKFVRAYFPNITTGANNLNQCRLKFTFEGGYYFAIIDDVSIEVAPSYDLAIARPNPNSPRLEDRGDCIKIGNNATLTSANLVANDIQKWYFGLRAVNHGSKDLLPSDSARIRLQIDFQWFNQGVVTTNVYNDTILFSDTLFSSAQNSIFEFDNLKDINFFSNYGYGAFRATYWVEHNQMDAYGDNDTIVHSFRNTRHSSLFNHLSKARISSFDGDIFAMNVIFPEAQDLLSYEYGSMYYFSRGYSNQIKIDSVGFKYYVPYHYTGDSTSTVWVRIYQFIDNAPADGLLSGANELIEVGFDAVNLRNLVATTGSMRYAYAKADSFVNSATGLPMGNLVDDGYYLITVQQAPFLLGNNVLLDSTKQVWFGVDEYNYAQNRVLTTATNMIPHSFVSIRIDSSQNRSISLEENRLNMVPSIGVYLKDHNLVYDLSTTAAKDLMTLEVYPNPAQEFVMAQANFEATESIQYSLTDVSGHILQIKKQANPSSPQGFNLKKLPAGTYFIIAKNKKETATTAFIKN